MDSQLTDITHLLMNIYKTIILILVLSLISSEFLSQVKYLKTPKEFSKSCTSEFINDINSGKINLEDLDYDYSDLDWMVYSDRSSNFLFNTHNGNPIGTFLDYMQPLNVKKVNGKWLQVYTLENQELGWVKANKILLNSYCLLTTDVTEDGVEVSIPMKKIIITSLAELLKDGYTLEEAEKHRFFYTEPSIDMNKVYQSVNDFEIYYVYKEQGGSVLLANNNLLNKGSIRNKSIMKGWIPRGNTTEWNNRLMLEPARSQSAQQAYGETTLHGYGELSQLRTHLNKNIVKENTSFIDFQVGAIPFDRMRKPVIKSIDENIKKVVSITRDTENMNKEKLKEMERIIERQQQNTNIIFVVDATSSMRPYFSSISESIGEIMSENKKENKHTLKFAVIIYRDYADKADKRDYNVLPLTADQSVVKSYLNKVVCSSKNKLMPEAQFNGIIKGFEDLDLDSEYSNVMVLIGDCGNHINPKSSNNYNVEDVADILEKYDLNVISFQVNFDMNPLDMDTYIKFNEDVKEFIQLKANKITSNTDTDLSADWKRVDGKRNSVELSMVESSEDFVNTFGRVIYAVNEPMETEVLQNHITKRLSEYMDVTDNNLVILRKGWNPKVDKVPEGLLLYIMDSFNITRDEALEFLQRNEVTQSAYVSLKYNNSDINALEHVVYMSETDYRSLKKQLNEFVSQNNTSSSNKAIQFQDRLISICTNILGGNTESSGPTSNSNKVIENLIINDVWKIVFGVEYSGFPEIKDVKLNKLASFKKKKILRQVMEDFSNKSREFCQTSYYSRDEYDCRVMSIYGNKFYWIPLEDLPGTTKID